MFLLQFSFLFCVCVCFNTLLHRSIARDIYSHRWHLSRSSMMSRRNSERRVCGRLKMLYEITFVCHVERAAVVLFFFFNSSFDLVSGSKQRRPVAFMQMFSSLRRALALSIAHRYLLSFARYATSETLVDHCFFVLTFLF